MVTSLFTTSATERDHGYEKESQKAVDRKSAAANDTPKTEVVVNKKGLAARAAGLALYIKAGPPSHADFRRLCGPKGPAMTWTQRAEHLGVATPEAAAEKFAAAKAAR